MYPAGGVASFRFAKDKDVVLGGGKLVVPAGAGLHMPITAVHHSPAIWEDPMVFKPERFFKVRCCSLGGMLSAHVSCRRGIGSNHFQTKFPDSGHVTSFAPSVSFPQGSLRHPCPKNLYVLVVCTCLIK